MMDIEEFKKKFLLENDDDIDVHVPENLKDDEEFLIYGLLQWFAEESQYLSKQGGTSVSHVRYQHTVVIRLNHGVYTKVSRFGLYDECFVVAKEMGSKKVVAALQSDEIMEEVEKWIERQSNRLTMD